MMSHVLSGALFVAIAATTPVAAQEAQTVAPVAAPSETPEASPTISPEEAALNARLDAFRVRLRQMGDEMATAARRAGPNGSRAAVDAVEARYRPEIDAMVADIHEFLAAHPDHSSDWSETRARAIPVAVSILKMDAALAAATSAR